MVLENFLQGMGHSAHRVTNGTGALNALSLAPYDLIFMDINIPDMSGPEITKIWRGRETNKQRLPIIALTAHATIEDRELCFNSGMDDFISKPISPEQLSCTIEKFCK